MPLIAKNQTKSDPTTSGRPIASEKAKENLANNQIDPDESGNRVKNA
jgi:hypothetical protein